MKKIVYFLIGVILLSLTFSCKQESKPQDKMDWWQEARFGMFIHWGIYSVPAGIYNGKDIPGIGEWIMNTGKIRVADYSKYAVDFNPEKFNAEQWVMLAKEAGMKYIVITSKHHDGFAMFDSKASSYDIVNATPFKRDPLKELADACKKHGLRLGFYYSQAQDWHHAGGAAIGGQWDPAQKGDMDKYIDSIALPQVKEILSNYGEISVLWWDTPENMTPERAAKFLPLLELQPGIIVNNRLGGDVPGDFETPEQFIPATGIPGKNWEACMTMNDTWGFKKNDSNWKSTKTLIQNIIDIASKGGNYLLNVGPTAEGLIPDSSAVRLKQVGEWMKVNSEAIYGTHASPFKNLTWGRCTQKTDGKNTKLYFHVFDFPKDGKLIIPGLTNKIKEIYSLEKTEKNTITFEKIDADVLIDISNIKKDTYATVFVMEIKGKPVVVDAPEIKAENKIFIDKITLKFSSNIPRAEIHYTTDGSQPGINSAIATDSVVINENKSIIVKAMCFIDGKPASGIAIANFECKIPNSAISIKNIKPGIKYTYYQGACSKLADLLKLTPLSKGNTLLFDITLKKQASNYGLVFEGLLKIPVDGVYTFYLESDDGSELSIDDNPEINNDGLHAMEEKVGEVALSGGLHKIKVKFFQAGGGDGLKVSWKGPGIAKVLIPAENLFY